MLQSHSILRRYTPPTCTLAIMAENSPLSRWAGQPVVKNLRFQLNLDDPKLAEEKQVTIKGDRTQLEALCEVVTTYVQNLLEQPSSSLIINSAPVEAAATGLALVDSPAHSLPHSAVEANKTGIDLQSRGLLNHELALGILATEESGQTVNLITLQLFDLANALDEYSTDILDLPTLQSSQRFGFAKNWPQIVAVALIAVGLSTSAIKLLDGSRHQPTQAPISSEGASSTDQKIATQLPPAVVDQATPPVLSADRLPPPPPVGSPIPTKPGTPTVTTPKTVAPSPSSGKVPNGEIASYPVPVPGRPTIIGQPVEPITGAAAGKPQSIAIAPAPSAADSARGASESNIQQARRGALLKESAENAPSTAFDTIPQVAEARDYFKQRWKPVEGLTQTLEYSLQVSANGTIQSIMPLKQVSGDYIDRTGMPLLGDPFVSPIRDGKTAKIRLVLEPDGKVQTFLEGF